MKIGFFGLGKLGLDCAEVFAEKYEVYGYDIYPRTSGSVKVCAGPEEVVEKSDWIFIAVQTPHAEGYDGSIPSSHKEPRDFGHDAVETVLGYINQYAKVPKKIVLISTVLPGTCTRVFKPIINPIHTLIYNPYLIAMGTVKWDMVNPEMVIIGSNPPDSDDVKQLIELYRPLMHNDPRYETGTWEEAESVKIFYNTYISAKVGIVNMIQDFAMRIGNIDVDVVTRALANSTIRLQSPKYMTAGMGDAGACHPRDNIALRWLAKEYDIGYDLFDTIMHAREIQAANMAKFLQQQSESNNNLPVVIHGKAYKPDVEFCIGSYSTLIGHYLEQMGVAVSYADPLADNTDKVNNNVTGPAVILLAHNRTITYGYTGCDATDGFYFKVQPGSVVVDPWRKMALDSIPNSKVVHYGNTRV